MIICTLVAGDRAKREFDLLQRSMAKHHPEVSWFIVGQKMDRCDLDLAPDVIPDRKDEWEWTKFITLKLDIARIAIEKFGYCAYIDADMVVLRPGMPCFPELLESHEIVLSPHYTSPWREKIYGKYNAGMFATRSLGLLDAWYGLIMQNKWFTDQKPLELTCEGRLIYQLDGRHNAGHWRYPYVKQSASGIMVNGLPIVTYHGHLFDSDDSYDKTMISCLKFDYPELDR